MTKKNYSNMSDTELKRGREKYSKRAENLVRGGILGVCMMATSLFFLDMSENYPSLAKHNDMDFTLKYLERQRKILPNDINLTYKTKEVKSYLNIPDEIKEMTFSKLENAINSVSQDISELEKTSEYLADKEKLDGNDDKFAGLLFGGMGVALSFILFGFSNSGKSLRYRAELIKRKKEN